MMPLAPADPLDIDLHRFEAARQFAAAWLPIETAPRDGTVILGYEGAPGERWTVMVWDNNGESIDTGKRAAGWTPEGSGYIGEIHPTHWMPLPSPPDSPGAGKP